MDRINTGHTRISRWKACIFLLAPFFGVFLCIEATFRILGYQPLIMYDIPQYPQTPEAYFWVSDPQLGYRNRPHGIYHNDNIKGNPVVTTDQFGYRNGFGWTSEGDSPIILFLGDSVVFDAEVNDDQTVTAELARVFSPTMNVRVLNAGIRGANTVQAKRMLAECLKRFPMIKVVVYVYCFNDFPHNLNPYFYVVQAPTAWFENTTKTVQEFEAINPSIPWGEPFFVGLSGPAQDNPALVPSYVPQPNLRLRVTNFLRAHSVLLHQIGLRLKKLITPQHAYSSVNTYQPSEGKEDTISYPQRTQNPTPEIALQEMNEQITWARQQNGDIVLETLLREMNQMASSRGAVFLSTTFTYQGGFGSNKSEALDRRILQLYQEFPERCARAGIRFINLTEQFTKPVQAYMAPLNSGGYDEHYGPEGTKMFAKAIFPTLHTILSEQIAKKIEEGFITMIVCY